MDVSCTREGATLRITARGRIDASSAPMLERSCDPLPEGVSLLIFDLKDTEYISSGGLRVILGAQKKIAGAGGAMRIENVSAHVWSIFEVTGFSDILDIHRAVREMSTEGCEKIGSGMCGDVYRVDQETVLKLYRENTPEQWVDMEKAYAKEAFVLGIPTAISYDVIACGTRRGIVFEMLDAKTLNCVTAEEPQAIEEYAARFADLARLVHEKKGNAARLPSRMAFYRALLPRVDWLSDHEHAALTRLIDTLPQADTCIHGDLHTGNVMLTDGQLMFIDMGDFSIGHPFFDLSHLYDLYERKRKSNLGEAIAKLDEQDRHRFWEAFFDCYFDHPDQRRKEEILQLIRRFNCVCQIFYILNFPGTAQENIEYMHEILARELDAQGE